MYFYLQILLIKRANQPISSCARQHLVDAADVEGMWSDAHVERIFSTMFHQIFVGADTPGLERLRRKLFILIRHQVDTQREFIYACLLAAQIKDADL